MRIAGAWLAIGSFLMIVVLVFHGPIASDLGVQMARIANDPGRWTTVHWIAVAALTSYAVTGLIALGSGSRLTQDWTTMTAWSVLPVGALWTTATAVSEATVIAGAAVSGEREVFEAWWAFAEGNGNGFALLALAVALIAGNERHGSRPVVPGWSALVGSAAGIASFAGWALGSWLGQGFGNVLWVVASVLMSGWTLWFGAALMQSRAGDRLRDA